MIVKMYKYTFLVYHKEYNDFLESLQSLGILHVVDKGQALNQNIDQKEKEIAQIDKAIRFLNKRESKSGLVNHNLDAMKVVQDIESKQKKMAVHEQELVEARKTYDRINIWGDFSLETIDKLKNENLHLKFFGTSKKKLSVKIFADYHAEVIKESGNKVYFVLLQEGSNSVNIDAEEIVLPSCSSHEIKRIIDELETRIQQINSNFEIYAKAAIPVLTKQKETITANLEYEKTILNTTTEAEDKIRLLEGWIPKNKKKQIDNFLNEKDILHVSEEGSENDNIPVLIQNNRFNKLFEPIGKLFSLPAYAELDLTLFFAPFFMLFFGFCLGDAGYGLLFLIGAGLYKLKAKKEIKSVLSLLQLLGIATIIFGVITGTFFGINLIETEIGFLLDYKQLFLNPDKMFNLALVLGGFQIVFAMFIRAANQIKQYGFLHSLSTFGWLIIIIGVITHTALTQLDIFATNKMFLYAILGFGGFLVIFFSDVKLGIFARIGKGIWDIYSTVTGIFGDILSYIRLFALGLSSAILGFVINDIGLQILDSSKIAGPIFFVVFLLLGHSLNILIASLGSFVHPMRLTFVEFYKNAGFKGGGKEYKPFSKRMDRIN